MNTTLGGGTADGVDSQGQPAAYRPRGLLFGPNIPACAAPLILALLGTAAAGSATGAALASGFVSLALFGLALSLPVIAVFFEPARRGLDWLAVLSRRVPAWTGGLLIALGLWSVWFAFFVKLDA